LRGVTLTAMVLATGLLGSAFAAAPSSRQRALAPEVLDDYRRASKIRPEFSRFYEEALARSVPPRPRVDNEWLVNVIGGMWLVAVLVWPAIERRLRFLRAASDGEGGNGE